MTENHQEQAYSLATRLLIACGAIGPIFFILAFLVESAIRPGYSAWHNFVSDLSLSNQGWAQIASFLICGVGVLCFAFGLPRVLRPGKGWIWGPLLLGIFGCSLLIAGAFVTDPSLGYYPPGTSSTTQTLHGIIHSDNAPLAFGSLTIAIFVMARRFAGDPAWRGWALYFLLTGLLLAGFFIATIVVAVLDEKGVLPGSPTGLLERIAYPGLGLDRTRGAAWSSSDSRAELFGTACEGIEACIECRLSDRNHPVAQVTASFQNVHLWGEKLNTFVLHRSS